ncbi:fungal specific transcription protein [Rutstroemia sp. NJR-2017a BVV2]|nr:fungal specific transcription protein [Rutstroemia sp. NJR-2017a BVV2]
MTPRISPSHSLSLSFRSSILYPQFYFHTSFPLLYPRTSLPSSTPISFPHPVSPIHSLLPSPTSTSIKMSQPHTYSSTYPQAIKPETGIKEFFEKFYEISDTRDRHEDYAACFTEDATLFMGVKESRGFEEAAGKAFEKRAKLMILTGKGMWEKVEKRLHTIKKVFPFGDGAKEVMLYGTVEETGSRNEA